MCTFAPLRLNRAWSLVVLFATWPHGAWLSASEFIWEAAPVSSNWDNPNNWSGPNLQIPDDDTDRAIVDGDSPGALDPDLTADRTMGELIIQNGGNVGNGNGTTNFRLIVRNDGGLNGNTTIDGAGSDLFIHPSPHVVDFDTEQLRIQNGGALFVYGGASVQVDDQLIIGSGSGAGGSGNIQFRDGGARNDGTLSAGGQGTMIVLALGTGQLDPDGVSGTGRLVAYYNSLLHIQAPLSDAVLNGTLEIDSNGEIRIDHPWTLGSTGAAELNFDGACCPGGSTDTATLSGANATLSGMVNVNSGTAILAAPAFFANTAALTLSTGSTLQFDAPTTIDDADSFVNQFDTTLIVNDVVDIGLGFGGNFNWDGLGQNGNVQGTTIVNENGLLRIQVSSLDESGLDERVNADITLNGGDIAINTLDDQWQLDGSLTMRNPDGLTVPILSGIAAQETEVRITGDVNVEGTGISGLAMHSVFASSSHVSVASGATLEIGGALGGVNNGSRTELAGGNWTGAGAISLDCDMATVSAATVVDMVNGTFDIDGQFSGDLLTINAPFTLNVRAVESSSGTDANEIDDPIQINGSGRLEVHLTNATQAYRINTSLDLNALGGGLASLQLAGTPVILAGTTDVSGNSMATARVELAGTMNIAAGGTFNIRGGTETEPSVVRAAASVVGPGDLVVSASGPGYLRLDDAAGVGADLFNHGHLEVGSSPGHASVTSITQSTSGIYEVEIEGLTPSFQYDQLLVGGFANLDGTLEVLVNDNGGAYVDPAVPGTFDQFTLILAADVNGKFDTFTFDGDLMSVSFGGVSQDRFHVGAGLFRILDYDPAQMDLLNYRALPGDANGDGDVDGSDFGLWNANKFTCGTDWTTGDFNGDGCSDGSDFGIWNANKFTGIDLGRPGPGLSNRFQGQLVPEPFVSPITQALIGLGFMLRFGRIRRGRGALEGRVRCHPPAGDSRGWLSGLG